MAGRSLPAAGLSIKEEDLSVAVMTSELLTQANAFTLGFICSRKYRNRFRNWTGERLRA